MGPCVPLSYISDSGVARICQRGGGGGQNYKFCTLNAVIRGGIDQSINMGAWLRPPPCVPLSYASEQQKSCNIGLEEELACASCKIMYGHAEAARSITLASWARASASRQRGIGKCMTEIIIFA